MPKIFFSLLPLVALACGSGDPALQPGGAGGASGGGGAGGAPSVDPCADDTEPPAPGAVCIASVRGKVVDLMGAPIANKLVTVCGVGCFYGKSSLDGTWTTPIGARLLPREYVAFVHGGPSHATLLVELDPKLQGPDVVLDDPIRIPMLPVDGPSLPPDDGPGGAVSSGGVTLTVAPATTVELDIEDLALGAAGRRFRAVRVEAADLPGFARDMGGVFAFALAPFDAVFSAPVAVAIDGAPGLTPGQKVELFALEDDFSGDPNVLGRGRVVASAHVSDDGKRVVTDPGAGVVKLNWLGVRPSP